MRELYFNGNCCALQVQNVWHSDCLETDKTRIGRIENNQVAGVTTQGHWEYLDSLRIETAIVASSSVGPATVRFIPHYFSDHSMTGYRDLVRRYRDGQARTSR
ncbi:MAG: hypothetical protein IT422_08640 [Pirellulaceae bacterium]|nr:hypothetical protein [Pirellulaceae bacterium]